MATTGILFSATLCGVTLLVGCVVGNGSYGSVEWIVSNAQHTATTCVSVGGGGASYCELR